MSDPIYTQHLSVWYSQNANGFQTITYNPQAVAPDQPLIPTVRRRTDWSKITQSIAQIQFQVQDLLGRAVFDKARETVAVERAAQNLSAYVLPPDGFASLLQPGAQPCMDIGGDDAAYIPWEALEEQYYVCQKCGHHTSSLNPPASTPVFCVNDGTQMESAGGKLALTYLFTHIVRCRGTCVHGGKTFLLIKDPRGDLCSRNGTLVEGVNDHIGALEKLFTDNGYTVKTLANSMATCGRVLKAITQPGLAGIYYFGHGLLQGETGESSLVLHDGTLKARDIEESGSSASFVFLNACEAGAVPLSNSVEDGLSVASAFAVGGPNRAVIAPIFPIETRQGADAALTFFKHAFSRSATAGTCMQAVRETSLNSYHQDVPDVRWLSYRYFGNPNLMLVPQQQRVDLTEKSQQQIRERVFDENQRIVEGIFGFPIDAVLLRAAKRRNMQRRECVGVGDLAAGLIRKGELTRFFLENAGLNPDDIYSKVLSCKDKAPTHVEDDGERDLSLRDSLAVDNDEKRVLHQLLARFIVRKKDEFTPEALFVLTEADAQAQRHSANDEGGAISEQDFLEKLILLPEWNHLEAAGLPQSEVVQQALASRASLGIDENGFVLLNNLDLEARRIIYDAHTLAQQRGVFPISNRVLLASLLERRDGYAARVCHAGGVPIPPSVLRQIIRATIDKREQGQAFGLSRKACSRIVSAVLEEARRLAGAEQAITEQDVFRAYCAQIAPPLKRALKKRLHLDLDRLKTLDPVPEGEECLADLEEPILEDDSGALDARELDLSHLDDACQVIVETAVEFGRASGNNVVASPHLFAAMIEVGPHALSSLLGNRPEKAVRLREMALSILKKSSGPLGTEVEMVFSPHTRDILERARLIAQSSNHSKVTEDDLWGSFFADGGGAIGRMLAFLGIQALSSPDTHGPPSTSSGPLFGLN